MSEELKVYIDRLRDGKVEKIDVSLSPEEIDLVDRDITFSEPVHLKGEAYTAEETLVLHLNIALVCNINCSICNQPTKHEIKLKGIYHTIPTAQIKSGVFHIGELIREDILLEAPHFIECNQGNCPERNSIDKYLKKNDQSDEESGEGYQQPFLGLTKE